MYLVITDCRALPCTFNELAPYFLGNFQDLESNADSLQVWKARKTYDPNRLPIGFAPNTFYACVNSFLIDYFKHLCCWLMFNQVNYFFSFHPWLILLAMNDLFSFFFFFLQQDVDTVNIREEKRDNINSIEEGSSFLFSLLLLYTSFTHCPIQDLVITMDCSNANIQNLALTRHAWCHIMLHLLVTAESQIHIVAPSHSTTSKNVDNKVELLTT